MGEGKRETTNKKSNENEREKKELKLHMKTKIRRMEILWQSHQLFDMNGGNSKKKKKPTADREFQFVID